MQQKRLIIALLISTAILFLWSYLVPQQQKPSATPSPSPQVATPPQTVTPPGGPATAPLPVAAGSPGASATSAPHRTLLIKTALYDAKFDSRGAEAISWIIKKNKDTGREIYSVAGPKSARLPLELVSPQGLKREPREAPLQLATGDAGVDSLL